MITLNQKQFQNALKASAIAGRLDELNRLEGYVPSSTISRRRNLLKKQAETLFGKETKEEQVLSIRIELPDEPKKEEKKSFSLNLKELFTGKAFTNSFDEDEEIVSVIRKIIPTEHKAIVGRIVDEL